MTGSRSSPAYALSRYPLVGKENIFFWTITNRMAPPAVFLLPLFLLFTQAFAIGDWKLYDTRIGLIMLYCVFNLPFAIWTLRGIVEAIPKELDEAAYVDGANTWQVLTRVILPLARPGLAVTAILTWVFAWNEYLFAATLTSVNARTITTGLAEFVTVTGTNWGQMAATAMLTLLPALLFLGLGAAPHRVGPDLRRGEGVAHGRRTGWCCRSRRSRPPIPRRVGFLPIETNAFDRGFIGVVLFVAIHLFWMRFLEPHGLSLYFATATSIVVGIIVVKRG